MVTDKTLNYEDALGLLMASSMQMVNFYFGDTVFQGSVLCYIQGGREGGAEGRDIGKEGGGGKGPRKLQEGELDQKKEDPPKDYQLIQFWKDLLAENTTQNTLVKEIVSTINDPDTSGYLDSFATQKVNSILNLEDEVYNPELAAWLNTQKQAKQYLSEDKGFNAFYPNDNIYPYFYGMSLSSTLGTKSEFRDQMTDVCDFYNPEDFYTENQSFFSVNI